MMWLLLQMHELLQMDYTYNIYQLLADKVEHSNKI